MRIASLLLRALVQLKPEASEIPGSPETDETVDEEKGTEAQRNEFRSVAARCERTIAADGDHNKTENNEEDGAGETAAACGFGQFVVVGCPLDAVIDVLNQSMGIFLTALEASQALAKVDRARRADTLSARFADADGWRCLMVEAIHRALPAESTQWREVRRLHIGQRRLHRCVRPTVNGKIRDLATL